MPMHVFTNGKVLVNGVDLSDHASEVSTQDDRDKVEITSFGALSKAYQKGLGDASIKIKFFQDSDVGKVNATLQPLINSTTPVAVEVREFNSARSTTNLTCLLASALLFTYNGLDGSVGDALEVEAEFQNASTSGGMTYPTS